MRLRTDKLSIDGDILGVRMEGGGDATFRDDAKSRRISQPIYSKTRDGMHVRTCCSISAYFGLCVGAHTMAMDSDMSSWKGM